jgi:hypothetical protein
VQWVKTNYDRALDTARGHPEKDGTRKSLGIGVASVQLYSIWASIAPYLKATAKFAGMVVAGLAHGTVKLTTSVGNGIVTAAKVAGPPLVRGTVALGKAALPPAWSWVKTAARTATIIAVTGVAAALQFGVQALASKGYGMAQGIQEMGSVKEVITATSIIAAATAGAKVVGGLNKVIEGWNTVVPVVNTGMQVREGLQTGMSYIPGLGVEKPDPNGLRLAPLPHVGEAAQAAVSSAGSAVVGAASAVGGTISNAVGSVGSYFSSSSTPTPSAPSAPTAPIPSAPSAPTAPISTQFHPSAPTAPISPRFAPSAPTAPIPIIPSDSDVAGTGDKPAFFSINRIVKEEL